MAQLLRNLAEHSRQTPVTAQPPVCAMLTQRLSPGERQVMASQGRTAACGVRTASSWGECLMLGSAAMGLRMRSSLMRLQLLAASCPVAQQRMTPTGLPLAV